MSYYIVHVIECDKLAYERMLEAWKQRGWESKCILRRLRIVWVSADSLVPGTKAETYLLYFVVNHQPDSWDVIDWLSDDLGVYQIHFSIWSLGECDENWIQEGAFVPYDTLPHHTASAEYDKETESDRKAPEGYTTYENCMIAVDAAVWKKITVDYTREVDVLPSEPLEELLREIDEKLGIIKEMLGCLVERWRE